MNRERNPRELSPWAPRPAGAMLATRKALGGSIFRWIRQQLRANRSRVPLYRLWQGESSSVIDCGRRLPVEWFQGVSDGRAAGCGTALRGVRGAFSPEYPAVPTIAGRRSNGKSSHGRVSARKFDRCSGEGAGFLPTRRRVRYSEFEKQRVLWIRPCGSAGVDAFSTAAERRRTWGGISS